MRWTSLLLLVGCASAVESTTPPPAEAASPKPTASASPSPTAPPTSPASAQPSPAPSAPGATAIEAATPPPEGKAVVPADATPGERDLTLAQKAIAAGLAAQPFGKTFAELQPKTPAPRGKAALGGATTHPDLEKDPIEVQGQVQFLEETGHEARFGRASIRVVRQYRYGKLAAAQVVIERIGRDPAHQAAFDADVAALAAAWKDPAKALGVKLAVTRNDLAPLARELPLRIVFEPAAAVAPAGSKPR